MYEIIKNVLIHNDYDLTVILRKIDTIWMQGKLTDDEYSELIDLARGNSDFKNSVDLMEKINELEKRIRALEENGSSSSDGTTTEETIEEYVAGKWYYNGDKCSFEGKTYNCIAPDGVVCVWSPKDYPAYWEEIHLK